MDFEGAAMAMIDEEQQDAVKELMDALADLYIKIVDNFNTYFGLNSFTVHDDWGSQMAPFFSPVVGAKLIVPAMRRLTDHIHSLGGWADFHSCGHVDVCVPNMIAAGWDSWSGMPMNDTQTAYEKYGDKIVLGVIPEQFDPAATPEADQRAAARKFVDKFCKPGKPSLVNYYGAAVLTNAFREELYKYSRTKLDA
jgi:uroporphyrinogen-III decarboxylase